MRLSITCSYCPFQEVELNPALYPFAPGWDRLSDMFPKTRVGEGKDTRLHGETWQDNHLTVTKVSITCDALCTSPTPTGATRRVLHLCRTLIKLRHAQADHETDPWQTQTGGASCRKHGRHSSRLTVVKWKHWEVVTNQMRWRRHWGLHATGTKDDISGEADEIQIKSGL